jgi:hypothetical protein
MKKVFFYLFALFVCYGANLTAQVNMGSLNSPHPGAVLDISQTEAELGLLLPRVELSDLTIFQLVNSNANDFDKIQTSGTGMLVYNTRVSIEKNLEQGLYTWDGKQWNLVHGSSATGNMKAKDKLPGFDYKGNVKDGFKALVSLEDPSAEEFPGDYTFVVIAGGDYASVSPESSNDAQFTVSFNENPTASVRKAIVLVTNPSGKSATFVFSQDANTSLCSNSGSRNPTITSYGILGNDGAVYLSIDAESGVTYFWTRNNAEVGSGSNFVATQPGIYAVHGGSIGCGYKSDITVTLDESKTAPEPVKSVIAGNNGVLCGTASKLRLYAIGVPGAVDNDQIIWFRDGVKTTYTGRNPEISEAGNWFAAIKSGEYYSKPSNTVMVTFNAAGTTVQLNAGKVKVNAIAIRSFTKFCKGGSLFLTVDDPEQDVSYRWYNGNDLITQTSPYVVPVDQEEIFLRLVASDNSGTRCPAEIGSQLKAVSLTASPKPVIVGENFACAGSTTPLHVDYTATEYYWLRNGVVIPNENSNSIDAQPGDYQVYYLEDSGCFSEISDIKTVAIQGAPSIDWHIFSSSVIPDGIRGYNFSVRSNGSFPATGYLWDSDVIGGDTNAEVKIAPQGIGQSAIISFASGSGATVQIRVRPANSCGVGAEIFKTVTLENEDLPAVQITPSAASTYCGGVVFKISRPANKAQSKQWDVYWNSLSAANVKAFNTANNYIVSGTFSGDGRDYYYAIPQPAYQMTVQLMVSGNVGKNIKTNISQGITLLPTVQTNPYTIQGTKCFNILEPGLGDYYAYTYELVGTNSGTIEEVIWTYSGTPGLVRAFSATNSKQAVLKFNAQTGSVTITAQVRVKSTGGCTNAFYQTSMEIKFQNRKCCEGYLAVGGEYKLKTTQNLFLLPRSLKYKDLVPKYYVQTGNDLCFYKRDVSTNMVDHYQSDEACKKGGWGVDAADNDGEWRLPNSAELAALQSIVTGAGLNTQPTSVSGTDNLLVQVQLNYSLYDIAYWTNYGGNNVSHSYTYHPNPPKGSFLLSGGTIDFPRTYTQLGEILFKARCVKKMD